MRPGAALDQVLDALKPELETLRHELHAHPEIRFEEHWTAGRIGGFLEEHGIPHTRGHAGGTGVVAEIEGQAGPGPVVVLRADMDALEIQEETGLPYASAIPQRMHACGHDGHSACLCGAAAALWQLRGEFQGAVRLIFQPAEEQAAGGRLVVDEGLVDNAIAAFALHGWPGIDAGRVGVGQGHIMAGAEFFRIEVTGRGGHAADPAATVDPVLTAAHIITALQSIISRECDPWKAGVVTVARLQAGEASNIIPGHALLEGTLRALSEEQRTAMEQSIERIALHVAAGFRAEARVSFPGQGYPPLYNDPGMAAYAQETVSGFLGPAGLEPVTHPFMTAEDFAFYLRKAPGAFLFLGNDEPGKPSPQLHTPTYDFNDRNLPIGAGLLARLAMGLLQP